MVRWRVIDGRRPNVIAHFVKGLLKGARMTSFSRGPVTIALTGLHDGRTELTPEERTVVDDLVVPDGRASGERLVRWSCAACDGSGEFIEKSKAQESPIPKDS